MATGWVSRISGPIAAHPIHETKSLDELRCEQSPKPSICSPKKPNGVPPLIELQGRTIVFSPASENSSRTASTPKDHLRENVRRMREIQRASKQREEEKKKPGPVKSTWRSARYENVPSRIGDYIHDDSFYTTRPHTSDGVRTRQRSESLELNGTAVSTFRREMRTGDKPPVVPCIMSARESRPGRREIDFVKANARAVRSAPLRRAPSADSLLVQKEAQERTEAHYRPGLIPDYLVRRRQQWSKAEDERLASQPDPDQPPGHFKMPESERLETLELLKKGEKELIIELCKLPITADTLRVRQRKTHIEGKLAEIEEALKVFSKKKVFIKNE